MGEKTTAQINALEKQHGQNTIEKKEVTVIHTLKIPLRTPSTSNLREHWTKTFNRNKIAKDIITKHWLHARMPIFHPPCTITLTRVSPRPLDYDNLTAALKYIRDVIADIIIPGLASGQADNPSHGLTFAYSQKKGIPKEYALEIQIEHG